MNILVIGGGGREHALAWKIAQSPRATRVYVAPGNAGTTREPKCENVALAADDVEGLLRFAQSKRIDLTVDGPEAPLAAGVVDRFRAAKQRIFGPTRAAAQLESSKAFCKDFLARHRIPTATYRTFTDPVSAKAYIVGENRAMVVKADGLAAGKGVIVADSVASTQQAVDAIFADFGTAGARAVVEDILLGEEASFIVMVDGTHILPLASSQDHKRVNDGDQGPNTGGMGAYSPAPVVTPAIHARVLREVVEPTVRGMAQEGNPYTGFLYAGLMIPADGRPNVLEFNCRFGDPETQPILMRLKSDLIELIDLAIDGRLDEAKPNWDTRPALGVVMAAGGYPGDYKKGDLIRGLPMDAPDAKVFHAGTAERGGEVVTNGGRVLCVTALGATVKAAQARAYEIADRIQWPGVHYRRDIGYRAIARE